MQKSQILAAIFLCFLYLTAGDCFAQKTVKTSSQKHGKHFYETSSEQKKVLETDTRLLDAIWNADVPVRKAIADESLVYTSYSGERLNKTNWINSVEKITPGMAEYRAKNVQVLMQGTMAVVSGDLNIDFKMPEPNGVFREGSGFHRYIHIYRKKNNQWFLVMGQMTPVAKYLWKFQNRQSEVKPND